MEEEKVFFKAGTLSIEGLYGAARGDKGVVISHPHPQMGGSMINNVVESMVSAFINSGFSTLRFNFRGVGASEGGYDGGVGEQDDVRGAIDCLREKGKRDIMLAGYSFGAWVNAMFLTTEAGFLPAVFVSPPVRLLNFDFSALAGKVGLVICGDQDDFCSPGEVRNMAEQVGCPLKIVRGADHFYWEREREIILALEEFSNAHFSRGLPGGVSKW
ncbi:MAG: alpha/beta hydrolase [Deltaproteobacteria bacterium]|nr:alpha/beta hydrolase [Deltaproteobacteria bacterium]